MLYNLRHSTRPDSHFKKKLFYKLRFKIKKTLKKYKKNEKNEHTFHSINDAFWPRTDLDIFSRVGNFMLYNLRYSMDAEKIILDIFSRNTSLFDEKNVFFMKTSWLFRDVSEIFDFFLSVSHHPRMLFHTRNRK